MAERIQIADFDIDLTGVLQEAAKYRKELDLLKKELRDMKKSEDTTSEALVNQETKIKSLNNEYRKRLQVLQDSRDSNQQSISRTDQLTTALEQQSTSIRELRANNKALNALKLDAPIGSKELEDINNKLDENNEKIKDNSDAYTKQKINIGNYEQAIRNAIPGLDQMTSVLNGVKEGLTMMNSKIKVSQQGFGGLIKLSKPLKIALISTGIGAIAVALGLLTTYLTTTQEGMDKVTKVTKPLSVIFSRLLGIVQELGADLFEAFTKPQEALKTLQDFITNQVINRFKALGVIIEGIINLDVSKIGEGLAQAATGVEDVVEKVKNAAKETAEFIEESIEQGNKLAQLTIDIEKAENNLILTRAKSNNIIKAQNKIAEDTTKSLQEREIAAANVLKESEKLLQAEQAIIDMKIEQMELENTQNDTGREREKELNELKAQRMAVETQQLELQTTAQNKLNIIRNQAASEEQAAHDAIMEKRKQAEEAEKEAHEKKMEQMKEEAQQRLRNAEIELETYKINNREKLNSAEVSKKIYEDELALLEERAEIEKLSIEELNLAKLELKAQYDDQVKEMDLAREEADRLERVAKEEFEFQQKLLKLEEQKGMEFEVERMVQEREYEQQRLTLENQLQDQLITREEYARQVITLDQKRANAMEKIKEAEKQSNINAAAQTLDAVASVVDQASAAGKAVSLAKAGINVFEAISKANAAGFPANIPLIAMAAATGYKAIKDITSVKMPSVSGGTASSGGSSSTPPPPPPPRSLGMQSTSSINTNPIVEGQLNDRLGMDGMEERMTRAVASGASKGTSEGMIGLSDNTKVRLENTF